MHRLHLLTLGALLVVPAAGCQTVTRDESTYKIEKGESNSYLDSELEILEKRAREYPKDPDYHYQIAAIHFQQEKYRDSAAALRHAIGLNPDQSRYHYHLGRVYLKMREMRRAEVSFREAVKLSNEERFTGPRAALAYVLALKRDIDGAIEHFERCVEIEPGNVEFYYFLGALYDMKGNVERAVGNFREYLDRGGARYRTKAIRILRQLGVEVTVRELPAPLTESPEPAGSSGLPAGIDGAFPPIGQEGETRPEPTR